MVSPASGLPREIHIHVFVIILEERCGHASLSCDLAVSLVKSLLELSSSCGIEFLIVSFIVDTHATVSVIFASLVVSLEVVREKIDAFLLLGELIDIVDVTNEVLIRIQVIRTIVGR